MFDLERIKIPPNMPLIDAIRQLNDTGNKILLIVENNVLVGVLNDGDIRRWVLSVNEGIKGNFTVPVSEVMNPSPIYLNEDMRERAEEFLTANYIEAAPIVNEKKEVIDIVFLNKNFKKRFRLKSLDVPVVVMAGGEGKRLHPYTDVLPKPLIPVNDSTILENIINRFMLVGCRKFYLSVNYKKNLIKAYLNELNWEAQIFYIEEEQYLGTCGSLKYLDDVLEESFIVTNCDILIEADYADIVSYHKIQQNDITVVAASKAVQFPYGVLRTDGNAHLDALDEKPVFNFLINTGFYVLEPQVLAYIPKGKELHMTQLIEICRNMQKKIGIYSIPDAAWMDMGEMEQLDKMLAKMRGERYNGN